MATIQADENGVVERVNIAGRIVEKYRHRADGAHTVELDASTNRDLLKDILAVCQTEQNDYTIVRGILMKGGTDVSLGSEDDTAAIRRLRAFVAGLSESSSDADQALGLVIVRMFRLETAD